MPFNKQIETRRVSSRLRDRASRPAASQPQQQKIKKITLEKFLATQRIARVLVYTRDQDESVVPQTVFKDFLRLPIEIQEAIYKYALPGPRTVEFFPLEQTGFRSKLDIDKRYDRTQLKTFPSITTPALLHVNKHSRDWAHKFYQPCFNDYLMDKRSVFIDFSIDTVILTLELNNSLAATSIARGKPRGKEYLNEIQNLAYPFTLRTYDKSWKNVAISQLKVFRGLRNITCLKSGDLNTEVRQIQLLKDMWSTEAKKRNSGITCQDLHVTMSSENAFAEEFGYDM